MTMDDDMICETFDAEFEAFLEMNPDLDEVDGSAEEILMLCLDLSKAQRAWLEDFCLRFDAEMDKAIQGKNP
jgi:hypothetical protein